MKEIIGKTMIGSHIWNMNHVKSDKDYFEIYTEDIYDILSHTARYKSTFTQLPAVKTTKKFNNPATAVDIHSHEVSHVIEQLIKGNVNYLIGVLSPIIKDRTYMFIELRKIVRYNMSKNCFHSINGMSEGNYIKYIMKEKNVTEHKCNQILREIQFGITILQKGKVEFKEYKNGTPDEILEKLSELQWSYEVSPLPEKPNELYLREWLRRHRIIQVQDMLEGY